MPLTSASSGLSNPSFIHDEKSQKTEEFKLSKSDTPKREEGLSGNPEVFVIEDCSLPCLRLRFLNRFRSPAWFLVFMSLAAMVQGLCINETNGQADSYEGLALPRMISVIYN